MVGVGRFLMLESTTEDLPFGAIGVYYDSRPEATFKGGISIGKRF